MSNRKPFIPILLFALFLLMQASAWAAAVPTVTQTFTLNPGWNAVYLEVQPQSNSPAVVFKELPPGSSVWAWQGKHESVQFIQDPSEPSVNNPNWLAIFTSAAESVLNNLYTITANSAYLVHLAGSTPLAMHIEGRPTIRHKSWIPDSFNLTGFGFSGTPPTFSSFFTPSNSHKNQAIYRLNNASGAWEIVNNPATATMRSGEAFWIYCVSGSDYQGPFAVEADGADGLEYGAGVAVLKLTLNNSSTSDRTISVSQLSSSNAVTLAHRTYDAVSGFILTKPLSELPPVVVKAGSTTTLNLAAMRGSFSGDAATVLELTDNQGGRVRVPVTATSNPVNSYTGLWSGAATLNRVSQLVDSQATAPFAPGEAKATPAELNLSLILHQDKSGQVRLLKQAIIMSQDPVRNPDGSIRTKGRPVVLTQDSLIPNYSGVSQRDGAKVGRRLSAVGIDYSPGTDPSYGTDFDGTTLKCSGSISTIVECRPFLNSSATATHPTNPFLHRYHPDHDNLNSEFNTFIPEVSRIDRHIVLEFDNTPKENPTNPPLGWGTSVLGGAFTEYISGLAKGPIKVQGNFTLNLATDVDVLNQ